MIEKLTMDQIRNFAQEKRSDDPVYWGELLRTLDRGFKRPEDHKFKEWLGKQSYLATVWTGHAMLSEEWAWELTDSYVERTRNKHTECYPVIFSEYAPLSSSTPRIVDALQRGHLLLGFITHTQVNIHPESNSGEPELSVDEAFVLDDCWDKTEVEPLLRGCFLYA
jgi:hypothetical protein